MVTNAPPFSFIPPFWCMHHDWKQIWGFEGGFLFRVVGVGLIAVAATATQGVATWILMFSSCILSVGGTNWSIFVKGWEIQTGILAISWENFSQISSSCYPISSIGISWHIFIFKSKSPLILLDIEIKFSKHCSLVFMYPCESVFFCIACVIGDPPYLLYLFNIYHCAWPMGFLNGCRCPL